MIAVSPQMFICTFQLRSCLDLCLLFLLLLCVSILSSAIRQCHTKSRSEKWIFVISAPVNSAIAYTNTTYGAIDDMQKY